MYTQYTIFIIKKKITPDYTQSAAGLKNKFETAVVNEPSVFEPLKFYCILLHAKLKAYQDKKPNVLEYWNI